MIPYCSIEPKKIKLIPYLFFFKTAIFFKWEISFQHLTVNSVPWQSSSTMTTIAVCSIRWHWLSSGMSVWTTPSTKRVTTDLANGSKEGEWCMHDKRWHCTDVPAAAETAMLLRHVGIVTVAGAYARPGWDGDGVRPGASVGIEYTTFEVERIFFPIEQSFLIYLTNS